MKGGTGCYPGVSRRENGCFKSISPPDVGVTYYDTAKGSGSRKVENISGCLSKTQRGSEVFDTII